MHRGKAGMSHERIVSDAVHDRKCQHRQAEPAVVPQGTGKAKPGQKPDLIFFHAHEELRKQQRGGQGAPLHGKGQREGHKRHEDVFRKVHVGPAMR
jgi:hypothetical protein